MGRSVIADTVLHSGFPYLIFISLFTFDFFFGFCILLVWLQFIQRRRSDLPIKD